MLATWRQKDITMDWRIGVTNLLSPENCTLLLIDHQGYQFSGVQNIDGTLLINNVVGLTKTAKGVWRTDRADNSPRRTRRGHSQRHSGRFSGSETHQSNDAQHLGRPASRRRDQEDWTKE